MQRVFIVRESEIQLAITKHLQAKGWLVVKIIQTNLNGWPDLQAHKDGRTVFIEVKTPGKLPDDLQVYRHKKLRDQGFEVIVATDVQDIAHLK